MPLVSDSPLPKNFSEGNNGISGKGLAPRIVITTPFTTVKQQFITVEQPGCPKVVDTLNKLW